MNGTGFIGVDVGTSGCKAVLLDEQGRVRHTAWRGYAPIRGVDGSVTQRPAVWIEAAEGVLRDCAAVASELGLSIGAIAPTGPAHTVILVDAQHAVMMDAILPFDGRSRETAQRLAAELGDEYFRRTFVKLGPSWTLPQLVWLRAREPDLWPRIRHLPIIKDLVTLELTGVCVTDPSDAAGTGLYDQRTGAWAPDLCAVAGVEVAQLPEVLPATSVAGSVTAESARRTGIPAGTPVAVGATDTAAELVSLAAIRPGTGLVKIASTGTVVTVLDEPRPHPTTLTYPHPVPGLWYTLTATNSAATSYSWLRETVFAATRGEPATTYAEMDACARNAPAGAGGVLFLPFLEGERSPYWDPDLRGAFLGLSSAHRRTHLTRAVLEGVALSLRDCRDRLHEFGVDLTSPVFTGGGAQSELWPVILASVLGTPGSLADPQGPAVGAAYIAAAAVSGRGAAGLDVARPTLTPVDPRPDWAATYDGLYAVYRDAAAVLAAMSHDLVRLSQVDLERPAQGEGRREAVSTVE